MCGWSQHYLYGESTWNSDNVNCSIQIIKEANLWILEINSAVIDQQEQYDVEFAITTPQGIEEHVISWNHSSRE